VSARAEVFLGIIAVATLATAAIQIGVLIAAGLLARRISRLVDRVERELTPLVTHLNEMGHHASRATALAAAQVERVDHLFADLLARLGQAVDALQGAVGGPIREGAAIFAAFRAVIDSLRNTRNGRSRARGEDEDALFV
jgi:hypothetical protein